jgi:peptidoglycan/xylan/chitin deacetylase (PgdA/CDA1 family)
MNIISSSLRHCLYPSLAKAGFFRAFRNRKVSNYLTIVTYHGLVPQNYDVEDRLLDGNLIRRDVFQKQVRILKSRYNVIHPEELNSCLARHDSLPPNSILITCDDGLLNNVTDMLPVLKEEGLYCLFFVTTDTIKKPIPTLLWHEELYLLLKSGSGKAIRTPVEASLVKNKNRRREVWLQLVKEFSKVGHEKRQDLIDHLRQELGLIKEWNTVFEENVALKQRYKLLSLSDLELLRDAGMILGSHTCTHPILSLLPSNIAQYEMEESRRKLEQELGIQVWALSYPFGDPASVTSREVALAERAGYTCAFVNSGGLVPPQLERPFHLQRVHVSADMTMAEFEAHVSGFHGMLQKKFLRSIDVSNCI